jgi:dihydrofolate reductase
VRDVVMAMMTTLNGRLDDPGAWVAGVDDQQYADIDRHYESFDAILVGSATYMEMSAYWPGALTDETGYADSNAEINQRMAKKMNDYRKYVFTRRDDGSDLTWANSERVVAPTDDDIVRFVKGLKQQPGRDIILSAGPSTLGPLASTPGLVDEYLVVVHPAVLPAGPRLFDDLDRALRLDLVHAEVFAAGAVIARYAVQP